MSVGRQVIVQGAFLADNWGGRPDVLLRVEVPSSLGDWSYEIVDTKFGYAGPSQVYRCSLMLAQNF
jgi:hypothetical protein